MNQDFSRQLFAKTASKVALACVFFTSVNLLAGLVAVQLRFPSLWGNSQVFGEYAMPVTYSWALTHWPSGLIVGASLLSLHRWSIQYVTAFRIACIAIFLGLLYWVTERLPFALFPAVDVFVGFVFSLLIVPLRFKENPIFTTVVGSIAAAIAALCLYFGFSSWTHRVPVMTQTEWRDGTFKLTSINVDHNYRRLEFAMNLTKYIDETSACEQAMQMAISLFESYGYDSDYNKVIDMKYVDIEGGAAPYPLGEISQFRDRDNGELRTECYLKYR